MPTTESVATQANDQGNDLGVISAWATSNDVRNSPHFDSDTADIVLTFGDLDAPNGATINGLEITVEGQGNNFAATPLIFLNNGTDNSDSLAPSAAFNKSDQTVTYGGSTTTWGIEWDHTRANEVVATIDMSTIASGRLFWDHLFMTVYYTEVISGSPLKLTSGLIQLTLGKITI